MDVLWSPWRYKYIKENCATPNSGCVFCTILASSASDEEKFILKRAEFNFVVLNIFPYAAGHVLIVPFEHLAHLTAAKKNSTDEMMDLVKTAHQALETVYAPEGINSGMNIGRAAGAGVAEHYHMHVLPRWVGDANFMTTIGETRTLPESLTDTYAKLKDKF
ncbi:MAG: HIT domain-containing protein [Acidobacteria bacterium ACB1]|nr:AP-4-A phosphorylase [Pyrinomonadaceae bacterium]MCE7963183.1 HIT domain-containing protein [Acidobacteria bacterium ACB1]RIJ88917.1 MAG: HIT family hydrolase [Acidobacteriota bacterium]